MTATQPSDVLQPGAAPPLAPAAQQLATGRLRAAVLSRPALRHLALAPVLALSAVLNMNQLAQNGYANIFYSAGVKSMLRSLHNFAFVSFDPGGLIMVDKPPLGLWLQAASAKVFGFHPLSLLLPEAIVGVITVAVLYRILARHFGWLAALAGALALTVFPSFVAVSRDNGVDPLLILLMALACDAALRAADSGRWRTLLWSAALVGLAFNTKTLAALLVVPGIALAYAVCAPGSLRRRAAQLAAAGAVVLAVSFSWIAFVELTPASSRPFVGGSTDNSELGLTFGYNGFGRVGGQTGGPGHIPVKPGAAVHSPPAARSPRSRVHGRQTPARSAAPFGVGAEAGAALARPHRPRRRLIYFPASPGPLRLFGKGLGEQGGWMIPFALVGVLAIWLWAAAAAPGRRFAAPRRRDPRLAGLLVLGGWFLVEAGVLSFSKGIVHPYYISALAPATGAMAGAGLVAFAALSARGGVDWRRLLVPLAVVATVAAQIVLLRREHFIQWLPPVLLIGGAAAIVPLLLSRRAAWVCAPLLCLLLVAPTALSATTWDAPVEGTFPAAGPRQAAGLGGVGLPAKDVPRDRLLIDYVRAHGAGSRWAVLTDASNTAAPIILLGTDAGSLAGYSGTDPAVDGRRLARFVSRHEARYVVLGGEFASRGGNGATAAALRACVQLPPAAWQGAPIYLHSLVLFDCAGRERRVAAR